MSLATGVGFYSVVAGLVGSEVTSIAEASRYRTRALLAILISIGILFVIEIAIDFRVAGCWSWRRVSSQVLDLNTLKDEMTSRKSSFEFLIGCLLALVFDFVFAILTSAKP